MIPPIPPTLQICRRVAQPLPMSNLPNRKIVHRVLHRPTDRPPKGRCNVPILQPIRQRTATLRRRTRWIARIVIVGRDDLCVGEHGAQGSCPVDAAAAAAVVAAIAYTYAFDISVG